MCRAPLERLLLSSTTFRSPDRPAPYRMVFAGLAIVPQAQLSLADCELVSQKDDHVTPTDLRDAMTRKPTP